MEPPCSDLGFFLFQHKFIYKSLAYMCKQIGQAKIFPVRNKMHFKECVRGLIFILLFGLIIVLNFKFQKCLRSKSIVSRKKD